MDRRGRSLAPTLARGLEGPRKTVRGSCWDACGRNLEKAEFDAPPVQRAHAALLAAAGGDWFWWFGSDQDSRRDAELDASFGRT